jgi:ectoine hydroxylase-related dioxygenase (phytanoyl-CoA dioxygenase family)
MAPAVLAVLSHVLGCIGGALCESLGDPELCELAALVSDAGARAQTLHPDTRDGDVDGNGGSEGHSLLFTCFVALQDVTEDMGPTWVAPRTHCGGELDSATWEGK